MVHAPSLRDDADVMQLIADLRNSMGDEVGHESAGRKFARGEAAPTPLVFEFVKAVFRIGAVAVVFWYTDGGEGIRMKKKINCPSRVTGA